jgi:hypothetical protein
MCNATWIASLIHLDHDILEDECKGMNQQWAYVACQSNRNREAYPRTMYLYVRLYILQKL